MTSIRWGYVITRCLSQAVRSLFWCLMVLVCLQGCSRQSHDGQAEDGTVDSTSTGNYIPMTKPIPSNLSSSRPIQDEFERLLGDLPEDVTALRHQLQRDWEVSFSWYEREEGKFFLAQLSFQKQLRDHHLIALIGLPGPLDILLTGTGVSDRGLALLARLRTTTRQGRPLLAEVWELHLGYTQVTNEGLAHLSALESLRVLDLTRTHVRDDGLVHLAKLPHLQRLILARTAITGRGLPHLRELKSLIELDLDATHVDDQGLYQLPALPKLRKLNLRGTRISDAGLARLQELPALEELDVTNTRITDACIIHLKELKKLRRLRILHQTGLSESGKLQLHFSLPEHVDID